MTDQDDRNTLKTIRSARKWAAHYKPFHKEPSCARKLRSWRRKLKIALAEAEVRKLDVPPDPYGPPPPPPPPPTSDELRAAELAELRGPRFLGDWEVCKGATAWASLHVPGVGADRDAVLHRPKTVNTSRESADVNLIPHSEQSNDTRCSAE